jgi:hypothetical protein
MGHFDLIIGRYPRPSGIAETVDVAKTKKQKREKRNKKKTPLIMKAKNHPSAVCLKS